MNYFSFINEHFPARRTESQKENFRDFAVKEAKKLGYDTQIEDLKSGFKNIVIGHPSNSKILITAHYDTSCWKLFPITYFPTNPLLYFLITILSALSIFTICLIPSFFVGFLFNNVALVSKLTFVFALLICIFLLFGPSNSNNMNSNTSGVITLFEIMQSFNNNNLPVSFILFDGREYGYIGSKKYLKKHVESYNQTLINFDCVGQGKTILIHPSRTIMKNDLYMKGLNSAFVENKSKDSILLKGGLFYFPSDQRKFPKNIQICSCNKSFMGFNIKNIGSNKDNVCDENNIKYLTECINNFVKIINNDN